MSNNKIAERIYEKHGEVGFWYFYKDSVISHLNTVWNEREHFEIQGIKMIVYGIFYVFAGLLQLVLVLTSPVWIPLKNLRKARKAAKIQKEWVKNHK